MRVSVEVDLWYMKIAFHSNQLSFGGTEVALFDYARHNREILGNDSVIISARNGNLDTYEKFAKEFDVFLYDKPSDISSICSRKKVDTLYATKYGFADGVYAEGCRNIVHAVFLEYQPHGDAYGYISEWLSLELRSILTRLVSGQQGYGDERVGEMEMVMRAKRSVKGQEEKLNDLRDLRLGSPHAGGKKITIDDIYFPSYVPYIVSPFPAGVGDMRGTLGIPSGACVFGTYGSPASFDLAFVQDAVQRIAERRKDVYFIFMNINRFCEARRNLLFLDGTHDVMRKAAFINTCDAMVYGRARGESFGLAIAEFSIMNKPVIAWNKAIDKAHLHMLGSKGLFYDNPNDLEPMLMDFPHGSKSDDLDAYSGRFGPESVMRRFKDVFLS